MADNTTKQPTIQQLNPQSYADFIWGIKEIIRDAYADKDVEEVILPFTLLRRLDCVLEGTEEKVKAEYEKHKGLPEATLYKLLTKASGQSFYNISGLSLAKMVAGSAVAVDQAELDENFNAYLNGFSNNIKDILYNFSGGEEKGLDPIYKTLLRKELLFAVIKEFVRVDLHKDTVDNHEMGTIFEVLIRYAKETTNEKAGQYYTPREIVNLLARLVFATEKKKLKQAGKGIQIYDPCCGTGGMLTVAKDYLLESVNDKLDVYLYGQEIYEKTYAIAKSDLLMKGEKAEYIKQGDTLTQDQHKGKQFDYMLTNPPFGDDWKNIRGIIEEEHERGTSGRFGAGLPDVSDGSFLFLQHMIDKWNPEGGIIGIVFNGSPLFNGDAGGGWSNIRGWILENDWLDTIVALPKDLFYGTGIGTYIWVLNNNKPAERAGKVLLINAAHQKHFGRKIKSLGKKQYEVSEAGIQRIVDLYLAFKDETIISELTEKEIPLTLVKDMEDFKYLKVTVERPLRLSYPAIDAEKIKELTEDKKYRDWLKKDAEEAPKLPAALEAMQKDGFTAANDPAWFAELKKRTGKKPPANLVKMMRDLFGERDENAPEVFSDPYKPLPTDFAKEPHRWHLAAKAEKELPLPDSSLRDTENIPWKQEVEAYFQKEVLPFAPDAWMDRSKDKTGYEIPFTKYFYEYKPLRSMDKIMKDIEALEDETEELLEQIKTDVGI